MSHTNQTTNYHLPQFIGTDKPAWLVDFNQAMSDIDTQMKANETAGATAEANAQSALSGVSALNSQVGGLQTDVTAIQTQMPLDEAQIATNAQNISTQASAIVNANNRIDTANGNITALNTKVGDLADLDTTDKTSIVNAVNEVKGEATPRVVATGTAGGTFGSQLLELKDGYNALSGDDKAKSVLLIGTEVYRCHSANANGGSYSDPFGNSNTFYNDTLNINNGTYFRCQITASGGATFSEISNTVCPSAIKLVVY